MKHAAGSMGRVHVLRLEPGEDVLKSIQDYCEKKKLTDGVVVSGIGSLDGCTFFDPMEIPGNPGNYGYVTPIDIPSPIELIGLNGIICRGDDGRPVPHIHASFADKKGNEFGGHLKDGNIVLMTVELVIAEISGVSMSRALDPAKGVPVLSPEEC